MEKRETSIEIIGRFPSRMSIFKILNLNEGDRISNFPTELDLFVFEIEPILINLPLQKKILETSMKIQKLQTNSSIVASIYEFGNGNYLKNLEITGNASCILSRKLSSTVETLRVFDKYFGVNFNFASFLKEIYLDVFIQFPVNQTFSELTTFKVQNFDIFRNCKFEKLRTLTISHQNLIDLSIIPPTVKFLTILMISRIDKYDPLRKIDIFRYNKIT
jgi:hypothetical protein